MTVFPFQINEVIHLYNRVSKLKPSMILDKEPEEPPDFVQISAEAKKKQVLDLAKNEVLERIRDVT
ncbi:MAG: hypothetical protein ABSA46_04515 [Thermodesulfovibrionales bacterium]|jgi:hypothetical protein